MIKSSDLMLLRVVTVGIFFLVACLLGGLFGQHAWIAYLCLSILTAPVWGGILFLGMAWVAGWLEQRARARRIARAKALNCGP